MWFVGRGLGCAGPIRCMVTGREGYQKVSNPSQDLCLLYPIDLKWALWKLPKALRMYEQRADPLRYADEIASLHKTTKVCGFCSQEVWKIAAGKRVSLWCSLYNTLLVPYYKTHWHCVKFLGAFDCSFLLRAAVVIIYPAFSCGIYREAINVSDNT